MAKTCELLNIYIKNAATRFPIADQIERDQIAQDLELLSALEGLSLENALKKRHANLLVRVLHHRVTWEDRFD